MSIKTNIRQPQKKVRLKGIAAGLALVAVLLGFIVGILATFLWGALQIAAALFIFEVGIHLGYAVVMPDLWVTFAFAFMVRAYVAMLQLFAHRANDEVQA
jgi:hypothetical protein